MRLLLLVPIILCLVIIGMSDSLITHLIKERIKAINNDADVEIINRQHIIILGTLFWLIPLQFFPEEIKLEYRVFGTFFYWVCLVLSLRWYLLWKRISTQITHRALLYLILPSLGLGIIIVPIYILLQ